MQLTPKEKIEALVAYICSKVPKELSGIIKLNKIIWFSEIETMYQTWEPLTGFTFIKKEFGPVPYNIDIIIEDEVRNGVLKKNYVGKLPNGKDYYQFETIEVSDVKCFFSDEQVEIINKQIELYKLKPALELSIISHDSVWAALQDGDIIPLNVYKFKPVYTDMQKKELNSCIEKISKDQYGQALSYC